VRDRFVELCAGVFVRWDKVVAVQSTRFAKWDSEGVYVTLEGGGVVDIVNTTVNEVFKKLDAAQERYGQERMILDLVCRSEMYQEEMCNEHYSELFRQAAERNFTATEDSLTRAVREYMGIKEAT
jgi:hypothetical protein